MRPALLLIALALPASLLAQVSHVYFGTGGPGSKGIYRSTFDAASGKLLWQTKLEPFLCKGGSILTAESRPV